ncbi:MAG TPA: AAA family ATPase [Streptosporangiaceae bacterium]|nr:AAA family ATPase [Streptosporangiaceae bacterium]
MTGAPGAGKTSVLRELRAQGFAVVEEAATDVIAREQQRGIDEPWRDAGFLTLITQLQRERLGPQGTTPAAPGSSRAAPGRRPAQGSRLRAPGSAVAPDGSGPAAGVQVHDRSVLCTLALARFLGCPVPPVLAEEADRVLRERVFEPAVFLVRPLGFIEATAARRISYADALVFGKVHEEVYAEHGFELIEIPPAPVAERSALVSRHIAARRDRRPGRSG